jgi:hypothetical protein
MQQEHDNKLNSHDSAEVSVLRLRIQRKRLSEGAVRKRDKEQVKTHKTQCMNAKPQWNAKLSE